MHLARTTPPRLASDSLLLFDDDVRHCFSSCAVIDIPDEAWKQAQLCLSFGGLGIRSTILHSSAVYIASLSISGFGHSADQNLMQAVDHFNSLVLPSDVISVESVLNAPVLQRDLSKKIDLNLFQSLLISSSPANRARLLSESAPHAASWLSVTPAQLGLHLDPNELQTAIKWWLGLDTSGGSMCLLCPDTALDTLGHHAVTCRRGGDVVTRHNCLRDTFVDLCRNAHLSRDWE